MRSVVPREGRPKQATRVARSLRAPAMPPSRPGSCKRSSHQARENAHFTVVRCLATEPDAGRLAHHETVRESEWHPHERYQGVVSRLWNSTPN